MLDTIKVLKKDGVSYAEIGRGILDYLVNGQHPVICRGNSNWCQVDGDITSIERELPAEQELVGFRLKDEYASVTNLPQEQPISAFAWSDDDYEWVGEHVELYQPVYRDIPRGTEAIPFEVIDIDCEPVALPDYVKVDFPANVREYRQIHHKYPCRIAMTDVFRLVRKAILEHIAKHKGVFRISDYERLQTMSVDVVVTIPEEIRKPRKVQDILSRRPKWKTVVDTDKSVRVLDIVGDYQNKHDSIQITKVHGENYADLQTNLAAYIATFIDKLDPRRWQVCPHCRGEGVVLVEEEE